MGESTSFQRAILFQKTNLGRVRCYVIEGEPWFVAKDVCECLGISNATDAVSRLDDDERSRFNLGRQGDANIVNEYGIYNLVLGSRKPEAKQFKRWITHEVVPSIRKEGGYAVEKMNNSELMAKALVVANETIERINREREAERQVAALKIEEANAERDDAVRSRNKISQKREASALGKLSVQVKKNNSLVKENAELKEENAGLKEENGSLREQILSGRPYMAVKDIPWVRKYLLYEPYRGKLKEDVYSRIGGSLVLLCLENKISVGNKVPGDSGVMVNTYPKEAIDLLEQYVLSKDESNKFYRFLSDYMRPDYRA